MHTRIPLLLVVAFSVVSCSLTSDDASREDPVSPEVAITAIDFPSESSTASYSAVVHWQSTGTVRTYEWRVNAGPLLDERNSSEWMQTPDSRATLPDSDPTSTMVVSVRAIGPDEKPSAVRQVAIARGKVLPQSQILIPHLATERVSLPRGLFFRWDSFDTAGSIGSPDEPNEFEYKLVRSPATDSNQAVIDSLTYGVNLLGGNDPIGWTRVAGEVRELTTERTPGEELAFGVRAVNQDGIAEPILERNRNFVALTVSTEWPQPFVTVHESGNGSFTIPSDGEMWTILVAAGQPLQLRWLADAAYYGSYPGRSSYALDIANPDDESVVSPDGRGGWIDWKRRDELDTPFVFTLDDLRTDHYLYLKVRDVSDRPESGRLVPIRIQVVDLTFEKFALIVDDAKFQTGTPTDSEHDVFIDEVVAARLFDFGSVDHLSVFPRIGSIPERTNPVEIPLNVLGQYKVILWQTHVEEGGYPMGLYLHERSLNIYSRAGGRLFFTGGRISSFFLDTLGNFYYPKNPPFAPNPRYTTDSFIWNFLHYRNRIVSIPSDGSGPQKQASGLVGAVPLVSGLPELALDVTKWDPFELHDDYSRFRGGIAAWEGVLDEFHPNEAQSGLDSLYTASTMDTTFCCGPVSSGLQDAVIAHRYASTVEDSLAGSAHGPVVVLNLQPWYFEAASLREACEQLIDWLVTGIQ